jgi:hypothetical protein
MSIRSNTVCYEGLTKYCYTIKCCKAKSVWKENACVYCTNYQMMQIEKGASYERVEGGGGGVR